MLPDSALSSYFSLFVLNLICGVLFPATMPLGILPFRICWMPFWTGLDLEPSAWKTARKSFSSVFSSTKATRTVETQHCVTWLVQLQPQRKADTFLCVIILKCKPLCSLSALPTRFFLLSQCILSSFARTGVFLGGFILLWTCHSPGSPHDL